MSALRDEEQFAVLGSLATAGLKVEGRKVLLRFLIVDSASRRPSEN